jgi:predicted AAA+ superfamily ATPase
MVQIPSRMKLIKEQTKLKDILIYEPHNMLISGVTNCGKTHFILDLIEKYYLGKFDYILILCPTYYFNTTYERNWIYKDPKVIIINPDSVKYYLFKNISRNKYTFNY